MRQVGYSTDKALLEAELARCFRSLFRAKNLAGRLGKDGLETDLDMLLREVTRLSESELQKRPLPRRVG